ncbi:MAG: GDP-mannose 4,6-dehydratase, partial [Pseudomonadota bacterium]
RGGVAKIDLTHVDDVVRAIDTALSADDAVEGHVFHISGGQVMPVRDIIEAACERSGHTPRWRAVPLRPALAIARLLETGALLFPGGNEPPVTTYGLALLAYEQSLNIDKARRLLGWQPSVDFEDGLSRTFEGLPECA